MQFIMPICRSTLLHLLRCRHAVAIQGMPQLIWFKPVGRCCTRRAMNGYFEDDDFEERHCSSPSRKYQSARYPIRCFVSSFYPNNPEHMLNLFPGQSTSAKRNSNINAINCNHSDSTSSTFPFLERFEGCGESNERLFRLCI